MPTHIDQPERSPTFGIWASVIATTFITLLTIMVFVLTSVEANHPSQTPTSVMPAAQLRIIPSPVLPRDQVYVPLTSDANGFYEPAPRDIVLARPR
ncbi:hypothetical protein GJW-30_1_04027 [Variibacter gotjawalensis]|uniref:Uncharacterized protein n=1 Tax=Variibacter gotjawalensis TaxID=1333996 RepID=A0A0S3Q016_9BRAD|nr:hypothetical protein [Variibacter gotjawalensis]NIK47310.1 hypothetical protein [Variibacter gotjawalensis]RZS49208.1 hypothetical protein EV661_1634 [Variibacter gotjawalensis]BAT61470.1 hypothetical protein GJW-30_1_04027 [Variibacter gotjawalensis]